MYQPIQITADFREKISGVTELLIEKNARISYKQLKAGDYILNNQVVIERKTSGDFIQSIIDGRLFNQCSKLRKTGLACLFIIEGNPFRTDHDISKAAVRGALLSIMTAWQIPVYFSPDKANTAEILMMTCNQQISSKSATISRIFKPKKIRNGQIYFLQGLPQIGYQLAYRLLLHFGNIENVVLSKEDELTKIKGIGKAKAKKIVEFIRTTKTNAD